MNAAAQTQISLTEVAAVAFKASRGQGLSWGMAEEAAYAVRWLVEHGFDGPTLLLGRLDQRSSAPGLDAPPVINDRHWLPAGHHALCPIIAGAALNDFGFLPEGPMHDSLTIGQLATPVMILPFVGAVAAKADVAFKVEWAGCSVILCKLGTCKVSNRAGMMAVETADLRISRCALPVVRRQTKGRTATPQTTLSALDIYASRTYVPASEHSRRNAGASGSDER